MKYTITLSFFFCSIFCSGQVWIDLYNEGKSLSEIADYMSFNYATNSKSDNRKLKHYHRWLKNNSIYLGEQKDILKQITNERAKILKSNKVTQRNNYGEWENISTTLHESTPGNPNYGPVWDLEFDKSDDDKLYAGTEGGLWVKDGTDSWEYLTNDIFTLGVSGIVADDNEIYILTGSNQSKCTGIYYSNDGGSTWEYKTDLDVSDPDVYIIGRKLVAHPNDINIQYALTNSVCLYTEDGWESYTEIGTGSSNSTKYDNYYDIEFHPTNPSVVYLGGDRDVYRVIEDSIKQVLISWDSSQVSAIAVTDNPLYEDALYVMFAYDLNPLKNRQIWFSDDVGESWEKRGNGEDPLLGQVRHNFEMVINPDNINDLIISDVNPDRSLDGGESWVPFGNGQLHDDMQDLFFHSDGILYAASDGGIFSVELSTSTSWDASINEGLNIQTSNNLFALENEVIMGSFHNGTQFWTIGDQNPEFVPTGDGFGCFFDYSNPTDRYAAGQNPGFYKNTQFIGGPNSIKPWGQPFFQDPVNSNIIWYCGNEIFQYDITLGTFSNNDFVPGDSLALKGMDICNNFPDIGYFANTVRLSNGTYLDKFMKFEWSTGTTVDLTDSLPEGLETATISSIHVGNNNPDEVYIMTTKWGNNLFKSIDGGQTWAAFDENLPEVPIYKMVEDDSNNQLYLATLLGVWYTNDDIDGWIPFNNGLGLKWISDLHIDDEYLYAALWGHGVWRTPTASPCDLTIILNNANDPSNGSPGYQRYAANYYLLNSRESQGKLGTDIKMTSGNYMRLTTGFRATSIPIDSTLNKCQFIYAIEDCIQD